MKRRFAPLATGWGLLTACLLATASASAADGRLLLTVVDRDTGKPIAARMHLRRGDGKPRKPRGVPFWHDHFLFDGHIALDLPKGGYYFELERGPEYLTQTGRFTIELFADDSKQVEMTRFIDMAAQGWWSGDFHVRRGLDEIELAMQADDLHVATVQTWSNRPTDKKPRGKMPNEEVVRFDGNRFYSVASGVYAWPGATLFLSGTTKPAELGPPDREFPVPLDVVAATRRESAAWADAGQPYAWDLPMLIAHGQIDSIELAHAQMCRDRVIDNEGNGRPRDRKLYPGVMGNGRWSQQIYFNLLDCGLRIPPSAGSGSGDAPNPIGYNRMYVHVDGAIDYEQWWAALRAGRVTVTNGPLLLPRVDGQLPGHVFRADAGETVELEIALTLSTRDPIKYLEIIQNGQITEAIPLADYQATGRLPRVRFDRSGWFLVRAVTEAPKTYRFAMTGPYYVEFDYQPRVSRAAVKFFLDWVDERIAQIERLDNASQREPLVEAHHAARDFWQQRFDNATVE